MSPPVFIWRSARNVRMRPFTSRMDLSTLPLLFESPTLDSSCPVGAPSRILAISCLTSTTAGSASDFSTILTFANPTVSRSPAILLGSHVSDATPLPLVAYAQMLSQSVSSMTRIVMLIRADPLSENSVSSEMTSSCRNA